MMVVPREFLWVVHLEASLVVLWASKMVLSLVDRSVDCWAVQLVEHLVDVMVEKMVMCLVMNSLVMPMALMWVQRYHL